MHVRRVFSTIDSHAGGQPLRIITSGIPPLPGSSLLQRRARLRDQHDDIRRLLLLEPRGHDDMYGAVLTAPSTPGADYGVIFMTNEGYSTMCGHGIIALTTALIDTGTWTEVSSETRITYDTPAGVVQARASVSRERVTAVRFRNVPSFRLAKDLEIEVGGRSLQVDVAFGGAWYAIVSEEELGVNLGKTPAHDLARIGMAVKRAVSNAIDVVHPENDELSGLYGTIITGPPTSSDSTMRNVTVYAEGAIDRSPCGTGTAALVACMAADDELHVGDPLINESLNGSIFSGRIVQSAKVGEFVAVVPEISGRGAVTGLHQFILDGDDPIQDGFRVN